MRFAASFLAYLALTPLLLAAPDTVDSATELNTITPFKQGIQALSDHLPEIAITRFEEAFKVSDLTDTQNREILYRLTEAQVRANQPEKALVTLNSKFFEDHPEREFWIAQAYAAQGKYLEAIKHFKLLSNKSSYLDDAALSLASLQLAIGEEENAVKNYIKARSSKNKATQLKATAILAEIYLDNEQLKLAGEMIDSIATEEKPTLLKLVLDAKLSLAKKDHTKAIEQFSSLFNAEQQLPPRLYQITLIGLADARHAAGQTQEATEGLLAFTREHQDSPLLLPIFERLSAWTTQPLSPTDPFFLQLRKWANRSDKPTNGIAPQISTDFITNPLPTATAANSTDDYLKAIAHFYYAKHLAQLEAAGSLAKAQFEHSAFRLAYPYHPLLGDSLMETAKLQLTLKQPADALLSLQTLSNLAETKQIAVTPETVARAGFIAGLLSVETEDFSAALKAFEQASHSSNRLLAKTASINLGLAALRSSNLAAFDSQKEKITDQDLSTQLTLERALWLAHKKHPEARKALSNFILKYPNNLRAVDARIALASICVTQPPLDPLLCKALLDTADAKTLNQSQLTDFTRTSILLAEVKQEWLTAIEAIDLFLETFPLSPSKTEFSMRKGLALYRNGEHNKARQLLGQIAVDSPDSPLTPFCYYYAGMAARFEGTPQALKESVDLFEKVIASASPLATESHIQQARVLLDINRTEEAKVSLNKVYDPKSTSAHQREIGILLATALHTQGSQDSGQYNKALAIYNQLLKTPRLPLTWSNQVHYMKGQTLESMGEDKQALESYYVVINRENVTPDTPQSQQEWKWFYQCGFKAIALLEKTKKYRAAVSIAKKIASYDGPESESYSTRARALEMEHMIWE